jgi:geranylgeranyl diphosphate synthase type 3
MCAIHNIHVSQRERDSVWPFLEKGYLSNALTNDLYSFHKEFEAHSQANSLDSLQNAMSVLMRGYGYTEDEACGILRQEILKAEKQLMDWYITWRSSAASKSEELRKYVVLSILYFGGLNYWMSHSPRYHGMDLATTREDRAQLIGNSIRPSQRLANYPPPIASSLLAENPIQKPHPESVPGFEESGIVNDCANELGNGDLIDFLGPFQKASAEKICLAPYEYTQSLPGKNTIAKFIDALQIWFRLRVHYLDTIKDVSVKLFNSSLMYELQINDLVFDTNDPKGLMIFRMVPSFDVECQRPKSYMVKARQSTVQLTSLSKQPIR